MPVLVCRGRVRYACGTAHAWEAHRLRGACRSRLMRAGPLHMAQLGSRLCRFPSRKREAPPPGISALPSESREQERAADSPTRLQESLHNARVCVGRRAGGGHSLENWASAACSRSSCRGRRACTWNSSFTRSSGAVAVRATTPARPPAAAMREPSSTWNRRERPWPASSKALLACRCALPVDSPGESRPEAAIGDEELATTQTAYYTASRSPLGQAGERRELEVKRRTVWCHPLHHAMR